MSDMLTAAIRTAALGLLARREHSRDELLQKLLKRFRDSDDSTCAYIPAVLDDLESKNYQSDSRFAEAYVKHRADSGKGPLRIIQELRERGVSEHLIDAFVVSDDERWELMAADIAHRRFSKVKDGSDNDTKKKLQGKQLRFLQYRGFTFDQINRVISL